MRDAGEEVTLPVHPENGVDYDVKDMTVHKLYQGSPSLSDRMRYASLNLTERM